MRTAVRRSMMGAFAAVAAVVTAASVAWACVPGGMTNANPWFCKTGITACTFSGGNRVGTAAGTPPYAHPTGSYYSMLGGSPAISPNTVSANTAYTLRWVTGDHSSSTDGSCHMTTQSAAFKAGGADASFTTTSTGSWRAMGPVSMPNAAGTYTICAVPTTSTTSAMSNHYYPFVVT